MQEHLDKLQGQGDSEPTQAISKVELEYQSKLHAAAWTMWQARRRTFRDILDQIGGDMSNLQRQELLEELTGEPDESEAVRALEVEAKERLGAVAKRRRVK
jgi:hypothetical protein